MTRKKKRMNLIATGVMMTNAKSNTNQNSFDEGIAHMLS